MKKLLFVTDFYVQVKGRRYFEEDLYLTEQLKAHFNIIIANPQQAIEFINNVDAVILRNTGPISNYREEYNSFVNAVFDRNIKTFNSFDGKADMKGKNYLLELMRMGYPIIPTVDTIDDISKLGNVSTYLTKVKDGADSIGINILNRKEIYERDLTGMLIQPYIDFIHEISFYFINNEFQYALYAPHKDKRWELKYFDATDADLSFAKSFIEWNNITRGITRIDACRLKDGSLNLVELEDFNPYLSIDVLEENVRRKFIQNLIHELLNLTSS